jgi:CubicO group peptidase (beta-lactamase class C family)
MLRSILIAGCAALGIAAGVTRLQAQPARDTAVTVDAFDSTFRNWMKENGVAKGMLAVGHRGKVVFERGYGGQDPTGRVLLASLSKAITGQCIAALIMARKLDFESTAGEVLAPFFRKYGAPADARIRGATVAQLLTHRGGFPAAPRDLMTPAAVTLLQTAKSPATATPAELLAAALTAPLAAAPGDAFRYSNIGYLVLGVMIETVTNESYEQFCGRTVLERAGIDHPSLDSEWRAFSSFGGWRLNGREYVHLMDRTLQTKRLAAADADASRLAAVGRWRGDPSSKWVSNDDREPQAPYYELGLFSQGQRDPAGTVRPPFADGFRRSWHTGTWGVPPDTIGMLAMQHESGASWFAWYTPRPRKDATDALTARLAALPATVTSWPARDLFPGPRLPSPATR